MDCINGIVPQTLNEVSQGQIIISPLDKDSDVDVTGELDFSGGSLTGWCLALLKREIVRPAAGPYDDPSAYVKYHAYALYHLSPPENQPTSGMPSSAVFNCRSNNVWVPAFNPLLLPEHTIRTIPVGP